MGLIQLHPLVQPKKINKVLLTAFSPDDKKGEEFAIYRFLKRTGIDDISAFYWGDINVRESIPADVKVIKINYDNDFGVEDLRDYDLIFRHTTTQPGPLLMSGVETTSLTKEFFKLCPAPIIGVTGTKGKGTTSSLIANILSISGFKTHLLGNIGRPALDELPNIVKDDIVIYELSSFQLWDLKQSPHIAVVLMIEPEHLDVHSNIEDYLNAKTNIVRWQDETDFTIYHPTNQLTTKVASAGLGQHIKYLTQEGALIKDNNLVIDEQVICSVSDFKLLGTHNYENITAAVTATWQLTKDVKKIKEAIINFHGLEHRLQIIGKYEEVTYVDDSISTTPSSAIAAIRAFEQPKILILGGSEKGADFSELIDVIRTSNVKHVILTGKLADTLAQKLDSIDYKSFHLSKNGMKEIIKTAYELAQNGDVVLLSPACASFDDYKNYIDRANQFKTAFEEL